MSGVGRLTLWTTGGLLLVLAGCVLLMISSLDRRIEAPCLAAVRAAPDGRFVKSVQVVDGSGLRITYADGLELDVATDAQRIVSALPGITEMLCHLGAEDRIVAVSDRCDYPTTIATKQRVKVQPFDAEAVLAVRADLLIVDRRLHRRDLAMLSRRVPNILLLDTSRSLAHLAQSMDLLAQVLGTAEAREKADDFRRRMDALLPRIAAPAGATPQRVLIVAQWDPLYVLGYGSLIDDLVRACGCVNVACDLKSDASGTFSEELVIARQPDVILTPPGPLPARLAERWRTVPAVRNRRFLDGSADDLVRAGPRILGALERLAGQLREAR